MTHTRKDLWKLGEDWNDTMLWYARAVRTMQARDVADATSWAYLAAMHGFDADLWGAFGYIDSSTQMPPQVAQSRDWQQCQHQSWYFLPWHRGYLGAFEAIVRAAIVTLGGPADWALPYWNYNDAANPKAGTLPLALTAQKMPDGSPNPLFVARRYGAGDGTIDLQPDDIRLTALTASNFTGIGSGGSTGFGGVRTPFSHAGSDNGRLENEPHNNVHVLVGGQQQGTDPNDPTNLGLMSMPDTAALDPVFWLHHANIDRLWEVWLKRSASHKNPSDSAWLSGPADRRFAMPDVKGNPVFYTPRDMLDTTAQNLDYVYEDVSDPLQGLQRLDRRLIALGKPPAPVAAGAVTEAVMAQQAELIGSNDAPVQIAGPIETRVRLDPAATAKVRQSFQSLARPGPATQEPDRIFLNLEDIRGVSDAAAFRVYVGLPDGADPAQHPENLAGTVSLFGVTKATKADSPHGGNGLNEVLEITSIVDALHLRQSLDADHLKVRFVPRTEIGPQHKISVGKVSLYRQGP
jgi:tyrosinase